LQPLREPRLDLFGPFPRVAQGQQIRKARHVGTPKQVAQQLQGYIEAGIDRYTKRADENEPAIRRHGRAA